VEIESSSNFISEPAIASDGSNAHIPPAPLRTTDKELIVTSDAVIDLRKIDLLLDLIVKHLVEKDLETERLQTPLSEIVDAPSEIIIASFVSKDVATNGNDQSSTGYSFNGANRS